ncbi:MAG TPA: phage exclusion protein Lit family protein [Opitutaceae bacterium]|jgi:hypothetical protein|nr:phage exclusion protein Lit family protein [Opitutaceae bacterium]
MPLLANVDPLTVVTPLQPLFPQLVTSFLRLSPHSSAEAERIIKERSIRFCLDRTTSEFLYKASAFHDGTAPFFQRLHVGLRALERTWAAVFGYLVLFGWIAERHNARRAGHADPPQPAALGDAAALHSWAFSTRHSDENFVWPTALPSPSHPHLDADLMTRVNATSVRVVGWMLLHELGHFERRHLEPPDPGKSIHPHDEEHEADAWAAALVTTPLDLDHCRTNLGSIPFALGALAAINHKETEEHPPIAERLRRYFRAHVAPLATTDPALFNTALFATTTPLQAILHVRGWSTQGFQPLQNLDEYLIWWEAEIEKLATDQPT